jgi:TRAP-type C4-dicarboxylate transport system permease small subunit
MDKVFDGICRVIEGLMVALLAVMVVLVFGNVVLRYGFNSGIVVSEELSRWAFVWLTFLGAIVAVREGAHLGTDMLVGRLGRRGKKACLAVAELLMLYTVWLVFNGSVTLTRINADVEAAATGWSTGILYAAGAVFAVGAAMFHAQKLFKLFTGRLHDDELVTIQESEDVPHIDERGDAK